MVLQERLENICSAMQPLTASFIMISEDATGEDISSLMDSDDTEGGLNDCASLTSRVAVGLIKILLRLMALRMISA
jgi:hypothetical protein